MCHIGKLQTVSLRKVIANSGGTFKPVILIFSLFFPRVWRSRTMNPFFQAGGYQWDFMSLSVLLWEMWQWGHICVSVEAVPHDLLRRWRIINVHRSPACDQRRGVDFSSRCRSPMRQTDETGTWKVIVCCFGWCGLVLVKESKPCHCGSQKGDWP